MAVHIPVLLNPVLHYLAPGPEPSLLVDCTLGEGGHSEAFLQGFPHLRVTGIDTDQEMVRRATDRLNRYANRFAAVNGWFDEVLAAGTEPVDRLLIDAGVARFHFEESERGFSFRGDQVLDMRLSSRQTTTAADIIARSTEAELAELFWRNGEERLSRRFAEVIAIARRQAPIRRTSELEQLLWRATPPQLRHGRLHPATRAFQALRIAVNDELTRLEAGIKSGVARLAPGGRIGVISFHSLEDRIAKRALRAHRQLTAVLSKPLAPDAQELQSNPAARSAKLRVAEVAA